MSTPNSQNVSVGKPHGEGGRYAGGAWYAPAGQAEPPTDAVSSLSGFTDLGYLSDDGVTNSIETDSTDINAFGGDRVLSVITSRSESFQFGMLETTEDTLKLAYGADNVTVSGDGTSKTITVKHNGNAANQTLIIVFEFALTGNRVKRIVVPQGTLGGLDDVAYQDGEAIVYTPTINALPDAQGNTAYEYIAYVQTEDDLESTSMMAVYDDRTAPSLATAAVGQDDGQPASDATGAAEAPATDGQ